jgi:hypothetical protein
MTRKLKIVATASKAMELAEELRSAGLTKQDFEWKFNPNISDGFTGSNEPSYAVFTFYDDATATFYELKWA